MMSGSYYTSKTNRVPAIFTKKPWALNLRWTCPACAFSGIRPGVTLGLMPEKSIAKILGDKTPDPASTNGAPRAELYLTVDDVDLYYRRAVAAGAKPVSGPEARGWGDIAAYAADPDSHIIAFARRNDQPDS